MITSIIIPIYNRESWIGKMFQRLLDLDIEHAEVIIVDDGSTDGTLEQLQQLTTDKFELKILYQKNSGPATARNLGFKHSSGKYIQFLDSDDFLTPNKVKEQIKYLESNCNVDVVYGSWRMGEFWESSKLIRAQDNKDMVINLLQGKFNPNFSYLFRREVVERVNGWKECHKLNDDFDFALRIAASGAKFDCVPDLVTGFYQWHPYERLSRQSDTANAIATYPMLENAISICSKKENLTKSRSHAFASCYWNLAVKAFPDNIDVFIQGVNFARNIDAEALPHNFLSRLCGLNQYANFINVKSKLRSQLKRIAVVLGVRKIVRAIRQVKA
ncbi:glycosyltransferase family 2 protein [Vibrio alginolyticus]|uniref:glycosyltransferase family 2 protein n=1 Tax=Vibrio alginolyticus TaxID=663 RepID=UPI00237B5728|nr:glycosyltransferase family A protein [Vibrio alginolyticus]